MAKDDMTTIKWTLTIALFLFAVILSFLPGAASAETKPVLSDKDCVKCHAGPVKDIAEAGGAHQDVACTGCHDGHPPAVAKPIPECGMCHQDSISGHFDRETAACLACHQNPHRPLNISLKGAPTEACLFCHGPEGALLRRYKSRHSELACSTCHDVHRKIPQCTQCHKPHWAGMSSADCKQCHLAHLPKVRIFSDTIPSKDCGRCHEKPARLLFATTSKHRDMPCVGCHHRKHKFVPACTDCHGTPHGGGMSEKFPACDACHKSAHDLNNWPGDGDQSR